MMTELVVNLGACDRGRLGAHLAESRRLMTAPLEKLDALFFRLDPAEARIQTPVTEACDAIVAAAARPGQLRAKLPSLSRQDEFVISHWLEVARDRAAGRGWLDAGDNDVAAGAERIRRAWDQAFNVTGDPADRSWMRTAAAWKRGRRQPEDPWPPGSVPRGELVNEEA